MNLLKNTLMAVRRREFICSNAPRCFKCNNEQVQLVNSSLLAKWKCRVCKFIFTHEPIIKSN
jgi:ribosomal protein L37AE/L43A